jgi:hypothetical protein
MSEIHFPPEIVDVDIDDVPHSVRFNLPDLLDNRGAGHGLPRIADEKFKERIFFGAERDFLTATMNSVGDAFELKIRDPQNGARSAAASPRECARKARRKRRASQHMSSAPASSPPMRSSTFVAAVTMSAGRSGSLERIPREHPGPWRQGDQVRE